MKGKIHLLFSILMLLSSFLYCVALSTVPLTVGTSSVVFGIIMMLLTFYLSLIAFSSFEKENEESGKVKK